MGTAQVQGDLWSAQARNWADLQERMSIPIYKSVFDRVNISSGTRLLDVGCGAGLAAQLAAQLGARVSGIDASAAFIGIARERVPNDDFRAMEGYQFGWTYHQSGASCWGGEGQADHPRFPSSL